MPPNSLFEYEQNIFLLYSFLGNTSLFFLKARFYLYFKPKPFRVSYVTFFFKTLLKKVSSKIAQSK